MTADRNPKEPSRADDCADVTNVGAVAAPQTAAAVLDSGPIDFECADTEQVSAELREKALTEANQPIALLTYLILGVYLGVIFVQSEVVSWFRIQEMFRFQSFHMYGIIGTAVAVAMLGVQTIKRMKLTTIHGEPIVLSPKEWSDGRIPGARYWIGGSIFGMGWALVGACPGPLFALVGAGIPVMLVVIFFAMVGTWTYSVVRSHLPH